MKLEKKKELAARTLGVGKNRILFNVQRLSEIKEAITKQDIKDLKESGAIFVKEITGRKTVQKRRTRRRAGSVRNKSKNTKRDYITLTRKLRSHLRVLKSHKDIPQEQYLQFRKQIRNRVFRSLAHMKESLQEEKE